MTVAKRFTPPGAKSGRRPRGEGKLSLHVKRGTDGKGEPYRMDGVKPLWKFTYRGPHGCKTVAAKDWPEAERLSGLAAAALAQAEHESTKTANDRTVGQLADHFLAVRRGKNSSTRDKTVAGYARDLDMFIRPHFGMMNVTAVTPEEVDRWAGKYNAEGSARTRQKRVILLGSLFRLAVTDGWRGTSPVLQRHRVRVLKVGTHVGKLIGDQRVARVLSADELAAVVGKLDPDDPALHLLVELTGRMGFRLREATHLRGEDVTFYEDGSAFLRVGSGFQCTCRDCRADDGRRLTKGGKARLVPLPQDRQDAVRVHLEALRARFGPGGWLFPCWRAKPRQRSRPGQLRVAHMVSGAFGVAAEAAGLPGVVFHDLRSTAKTHLLMSGANAVAVDVALGHQLPGMSSIYVQLETQPALLYKGVYPAWTPRLTVVKTAKAG